MMQRFNNPPFYSLLLQQLMNRVEDTPIFTRHTEL
jgi:hypothetical protein